MAGGFVLSLDFELFWGMRDHQTLASYGANILGARKAIPRLLECFDRHGISATWATVGMLMFDDRDELMAALPNIRPTYEDPRFSPYEDLGALGADEKSDPYRFALSLVRLIQSAPAQEIATQTFSHYYCLEAGQTLEQFRADLQAARRRAEQLGIQLRSIVFPYNQHVPDYLSVCAEMGLTAVRGQQHAWMYQPAYRQASYTKKRLARLADCYFNLTGSNPARLERQGGLVNVSASAFLRPYSPGLAAFDQLKLRRITEAMEQCAKTGAVYHLWFHPHNFGLHQDENFAGLETILTKAKALNEMYGWPTKTMADVAAAQLS